MVAGPVQGTILCSGRLLNKNKEECTINRLTIIGNLTRDPESRVTSNGKNVCNFDVAVNRRQKDENGNRIADFFRVAAWGAMGDNCQNYLAKGRKVAVTGQVSARAYMPKDGGEPKASLEVFAEDVEFLSPREDGNAAAAPNSNPSGAVQVESDELPF